MFMTQVPWIITYSMITTCWLIVCLPYTAVVVWLSVSTIIDLQLIWISLESCLFLDLD